MSSPSAADVIRHQLRYSWSNSRRLLVGLEDDEYFWEPVAPCWSVRRRGPEVRGWGAGEFVCEDAWPPPSPLPTTTIGWRVVHLAAWTDIYRGYAFDHARPTLDEAEVPGTAEAGVDWLIRAQDEFLAEVDGTADAAMFGFRPAHWGESLPLVALITTMLTEHVHHLAEIGLLRDLRRGHGLDLPPPTSASKPPWWPTG